MNTLERIIIERYTDGYEWPYVAVLQIREDWGWAEEDAMTGTTKTEALRELREINPRARNAEVIR